MSGIYEVVLRTSCGDFLQQAIAEAWDAEADSIEDLRSPSRKPDCDFAERASATLGVNFSQIEGFSAFTRNVAVLIQETDDEQIRSMEVFVDGQFVIVDQNANIKDSALRARQAKAA